MKNKGFSLIELMVVIAIVGVLAAIAAPVYQSYQISARTNSIVPVMDGLVEQAKIFYETRHNDPVTGGYPTPYNLGLNSNPFDASVADPGALSPYLNNIYFQCNNLIRPNQCNYLQIVFDINPQAVGYSTSEATYLYMQCVLYKDTNTSVWETSCFYSSGS